MKLQLQYMYRNDPFALSMIDMYLNQFAAYTQSEQTRLKYNEDALRIDFESYLEGFESLEEEWLHKQLD